MRPVRLVILFVVASTFLLNVESIHLPRRQCGHDLLISLKRYFHDTGIHPFVDGVNEGIRKLLIEHIGIRKHKDLLSILAAIPENTDLVSLLGGGEESKKSKGGKLSQIDALKLLIKLSKLKCSKSKCKKLVELENDTDEQKKPSVGNHHDLSNRKQNNLQKIISRLLKKFFSDVNSQLNRVIDEISGGLDRLIKQKLGKGKDLQVLLGILSGVPNDIDIKYVFEDSETSEPEGGLVKRTDILRILIQLAQVKCKNRECKVPNIGENSNDSDPKQKRPRGGKNHKDQSEDQSSEEDSSTSPERKSSKSKPSKDDVEDEDQSNEKGSSKPSKRKPSKRDDSEDDDESSEGDSSKSPKTKPRRSKPTKGNAGDCNQSSGEGSNKSNKKNPKEKPCQDGPDDEEQSTGKNSSKTKNRKPSTSKPPKYDEEDENQSSEEDSSKSPKRKPSKDEPEDDVEPTGEDSSKQPKNKHPEHKPSKGRPSENESSEENSRRTHRHYRSHHRRRCHGRKCHDN